jgi:hypothetical protein
MRRARRWAALLRPGNAGANTAADHETVLYRALEQIPENAWVAALDQDGSARANGQVCEITDRVELSSWPEGSKLIVGRER